MTTFGATIVPTTPDDHDIYHIPRPLFDTPNLTPAVSRDGSAADFYDRPVPPHSPFYNHPPASHEIVADQIHTRQNSRNGKLDVGVYEKDIESGNATPLSTQDDDNPFTKQHLVEDNKEDNMWPSKQTLKQKRKAERKEKWDRKGCVKGCAPLRAAWSKLSKRNRILIQVALALFIIGVAVALGVGISTAVEGTYYTGEGSSKQVGQ